MSYTESASDGNLGDMVRFAVLNGALWAVGTSWSTAIRSVTLRIIPDDGSRDVVLGELAAATITTILSVGASYIVMRRCCRRSDADATSRPPSPATRPRRAPGSRV